MRARLGSSARLTARQTDRIEFQRIGGIRQTETHFSVSALPNKCSARAAYMTKKTEPVKTRFQEAIDTYKKLRAFDYVTPLEEFLDKPPSESERKIVS
jgi:hypothetical protein